MPVPNTNTSLSDIQTEFGGSNPIELSEYYSNGPLVPSAAPAPNGPIPTSGQISIGQFRGSENLSFIQATGGTVTTCGDFKIHTFTGGGTFCVSAVGTNPACNVVDYMVVAGGGSGGADPSFGAGGGAGGFRESPGSKGGSYSTSPLAGGSQIPVSVQGYPVSVGGAGSNSSFATITSARGGAGGAAFFNPGEPGGSGGGAQRRVSGAGLGNVPPVSPPQGNPGGNGPPNPDTTLNGSAGGGATSAGGFEYQPGGAGATTSAPGSSTTFSQGGNGSTAGSITPTPPGSGNGGTKAGGGASGTVVIRYKYQAS